MLSQLSTVTQPVRLISILSYITVSSEEVIRQGNLIRNSFQHSLTRSHGLTLSFDKIDLNEWTQCVSFLICVGVRQQLINGGRKTIANGPHTVNKDGVGVCLPY